MKLSSKHLPPVNMCACLCLCVGLSAMFSLNAHADPAGSSADESGQYTVTPPRLIRQVQLEYPPEALDSQLHGDVSVVVKVDIQGRVEVAQFEEGDPVFEQAALDAASRLVFEPAYLDGQAVSVNTRVFFHFAPPVHFDDSPGMEIIVHTELPEQYDTRARTTLDAEDLERSASDNLAETVTQVAGVRLAGGSTDAGKPIIRGHQERRLLVLNDGIRHESQKWGPDHAPEIDPFSAGSISVIRGAAGTRYGTDAIGGVILVEPPPLRIPSGYEGRILTSFSSNGLEPYTAFRVDTGSENGLSTRVEGNLAVGASKSAPDYVLGNTGSRTWNIGGVLAQEVGSGRVTASWHHYQFEAGIFYGVTSPSPDEFLAQLERERPVGADLWEVSYDIDRPYQSVSHDVGLVRGEWGGDWGIFEVVYAFQINLREEFERVRDNITGSQFDFTLRTHSLDSFYQHPTIAIDLGDLEGGLGFQISFQENVYRGLSLIPSYRGLSGGLFAYERLVLERIDVEFGARLDGLSRTAFLQENDYEAHVRRGVLDDNSCDSLEYSYRCPSDYTAGSVSLGTLVHVVPEHWDIKLDLSTAARFPDVDELYIIGHAPSLPVYSNGYPDLGIETVWNGSVTSGVRSQIIEAEVSAYAQVIEDYIYFAPELTQDGQPKVEVTIRGSYPGWGFKPIDARFLGMDGSLSLGLDSPIGLRAIGGLVRAEERDSGEHLIGTPGDYLILALVGRAPDVGPFHELEADLSVELVAEQARVDPDLDFAAPPSGYSLLGASINTVIGRRRPVRLGIDARNILNTSYRDYSSLLRYYADQPGRDIQVRAGMDF